MYSIIRIKFFKNLAKNGKGDLQNSGSNKINLNYFFGQISVCEEDLIKHVFQSNRIATKL